MGDHSAIQWTDATWNPVVGCTKVSQGCKHCYAKTLHDMRHKAKLDGKVLAEQYAHPFERVQLMPQRLPHPLSWRKPRRVFVNSMADLFHEDVPDEFILEVFMVMAEAERHTFQILTKRPERMRRWFAEYLPDACSGESPAPVWPLPNVWLGVSVENQEAADERVLHLLATPAAVRFLSCEPLLGRVSFRWAAWAPLNGQRVDRNEYDGFRGHIDWVIAGGESGPKARGTDLRWLSEIVRQCRNAGVPVFVKQLGDVPMEPEEDWRGRARTRILNARNDRRVPDGFVPLLYSRKGDKIEEWPAELQVREFPERAA